jgi:SAM-dependent methyltransferase
MAQRPAARTDAGAGPDEEVPRRDLVGEHTLELFGVHDGYNGLIWERLRSLGEAGGRVLEIGGGIGNLTRRILAEPRVTLLHSIEPNEAYVRRVRAEIDDPRFEAFCTPAESYRPPSLPYDLAVSANVFEHIDDDVAALRVVERALRPGGQFWLLVPAHPALFSPLDAALSHHRRYTRADLEALAASGAWKLERVFHFNPLGALGWWWNGKVLRRSELPEGQVALYSRFFIPLSRWLDRLNPLPLGISLVARLRRL